jgi:NitT/TauT family transport system permease protein
MNIWRWRFWLPPLVFGLVVCGVLEAYLRIFHVSHVLLPLPSGVGAELWTDRMPLLWALWITTQEAMTAFAGSASIGLLLALLLANSVWIRRAVFPYTVLLQTVPVIAIAPILVLAIGPGFPGVATAAFVVSIFPVIANALSGLVGTDPALLDLFRLYGAGRIKTLLKLRLPFATPEIITGLRVAGGLSVIGAIVAEALVGEIGDDEGLGVKILNAAVNDKPERMFAGVLVASALGIGLFAAVNAAGYLLLRRWHPSARRVLEQDGQS